MPTTIDFDKKEYKDFNGMSIKPSLQDYKKKDVIDGLQIIKYPIFPSEGGDFAEFIRIQDYGVSLGRRESMMEIKNFYPKQISRSYTPSGIIKAWHIHSIQNEIWFPVQGKFILGFYDNREDSPTKGAKMKVYAGSDNQIAVFIPAGVAHGYKSIGNDDSLLVYFTDQHWDGADEGRLEWDSKEINFNWEIDNG